MPTVTARRQLGAISYRERRGAFEIRLRERPGAPHKSYYLRAANTAEGRRAAEAMLAEKIAGLGRGERHIGRRLTVGAYLDSWVELQTRLKHTSKQAYADRIRLYLKPAFGHFRLAELTSDEVTRGFARLAAGEYTSKTRRTAELSPGSIDAAFRVLNAAYNDAVESHPPKAPRNPCRSASVPRPHTMIEPPTQAELDLFMAALGDHPYRAVFEVMRWTGARHGEVLGITRRQFNPEAGLLTFWKQATGTLKSRRPRTVLLPPHVVELLEAIPPHIHSELIFHTSTGGRLDQRKVLRIFDTAIEAAKIRPQATADLDKYRPHDLRHAFAVPWHEAPARSGGHARGCLRGVPVRGPGEGGALVDPPPSLPIPRPLHDRRARALRQSRAHGRDRDPKRSASRPCLTASTPTRRWSQSRRCNGTA